MDERRIEALRRVIEARMTDTDPAHDFLHVLRVERTARELATREGADVEIVVAAALSHELFNFPKDHPQSAQSGAFCAEVARILLTEQGFDARIVEGASAAILVHAYSAGIPADTLEAKVLQDADRLDAIGAIGVARFFATSATMKRPFYSNVDPFCRARSPNDKQFALDHYFKKLARIPERLNTAHAKTLAVPRMAAMAEFIGQLMSELAPSTIEPSPQPPRMPGAPVPVSPEKKT